jgi:hypothetical protein
MTSRAIPVQWAWRGKELNDAGYRILSCSTGDFNAKNFDDILDRFSPGTLEDPSQVAVSYVLLGDGTRHLGMAIYEPATVGGVDHFGRDIQFARYFCVPYEDVAPGGLSYLDMYSALQNRVLPQANEPPLSVAFPHGDPGIPDDAVRALQVTELLLTGNPVCIVGAGSTSMEERLAFIDAVMRLLPYGMRAEMAAATWTSSIFRGHKFRLFFSEAPRRQPDSGPGDHVVGWRPDKLEVRRALSPRFNPEWADEYHEWMRPLLEKSVAERFAGQTEPRSFKPADILKMVEMVGSASRQRGQRAFRLWNQGPKADAGGNPVSAGPADEKPGGGSRGGDGPSATPQQAGRPGEHAKPDHGPVDRIALLIGGFERDLQAGKAALVETAAELLAAELGKDPPSEAQRRQYRAIIKQGRLLREDLPLGKRRAPFFKVLLQAAFGADIEYAHYLRIEDVLGGEALHKQLLQVIEEATADRRLKFLMAYYLAGGRYPRSALNPLPFIEFAADPELREDHAQIIWDAMTLALAALSKGDREIIRAALCERGFLAQRVHARMPFDLNYQAEALRELLEALYGDRLDGKTLEEIFTGNRHAPTHALLIAAIQLIDPTAEDALPNLLYYFLQGCARASEIGQDLREGFARLGYGAYPETGSGGSTSVHDRGETQRHPGRDDEVQLMRAETRDPQRLKRGSWDRVVGRRGEFSRAEGTEAAKKKQQDDER